jgi:hypothetical protein
MGPIEILLGVAFPLLIAVGLGLGMGGSNSIEFWVARACFAAAAVELLGIVVWWLYSTESASWKLAIAAVVGVSIVAALPESLKWLDGKENAVIAQRTRNLVQETTDLAPFIQALRDSQQSNADQKQSLEIIQQILAQYDQLQYATKLFEARTGIADTKDRLAASEHILTELKTVIGNNVQLRRVGNGGILIIKTAPNVFRVTFNVPMRIAPKLTFYDLPSGSMANVVELSNVGFTVVFTPADIPVENFNFTASAEL